MAFVAYGLLIAFVVWVLVIAWRWLATVQAEAETYERYVETGELNKDVDRPDFRKVFMWSEGPLFGTVLLGSTVIACVALPILLIMFNFVWRAFWLSSGESPVLELGQLPHLLILTIAMVGALFAIAYVCMRWYHQNRPKKLRTEIARLNSEVSQG